jgi:SOS-response transcriptional repressor LexA
MPHRIQALLVSCQQEILFETIKKNCKDVPMTTYERIKQARESAGYTQKELAKLLKVAQQAVHQWELAPPAGTHPKKINELAALLGVSVEWLLNGEEDIECLPYSLAPRCPLLEWEDAVEWPSNKKELKENKKLQYPAKNIVLSGKCYQLEIEDDSMVNYLGGGKGFYPGKKIIIDPKKGYSDKSFVVAQIKNFPKLIFRQFIEGPGGAYLAALNAANKSYPPIDFTEDVKIMGVAVAYLDILA